MIPQPLDSSATATPRSSATVFVQMLKWTIVCLFLILALIFAIAWFILHPREPGFRVTSLSVSNFNATDSQLRGKYRIDLNITNPNKKIKVGLDNFEFLVCYDHGKVEPSVPVKVVQQQPIIYVDKMSYKEMKVELSLEETHTPPAPTNELAGNKGVVKFNVNMKVRVTYEDGIWPTRENFLDVDCHVRLVPVKDTPNNLLGIGKQCHVDVTS